MKFRIRTLSIAAAILVMCAIGVSQLEAQSTITLQSLSERIDNAFQQIWELERKENSTTSNLDIRVSRLETRVASSSSPTPRPTATRVRPTATRPKPTPTRIRATDTPVPVVPFVTITRPMNLRRGPGTVYAIVRVADVGDRFDITGRNSQGSWWRIDLEGENAWVYAAFVTATNADRTQPVPTPPRPRPTRQPTATSAPQSSASIGEEDDWDSFDYALALIMLDRSRPDLLREWESYSLVERSNFVRLTQGLLEGTAEYCRMSVPDAAKMVNTYGNLLDESGYTTRNDVRVRNAFMLVLIQAKESDRTPSACDIWLARATRRLIASE